MKNIFTLCLIIVVPCFLFGEHKTIAESSSRTASTFITTQNGDWGEPSTWVGGSVPPSNATSDITIAHAVSSGNLSGTNPTIVKSITINSGASLTCSFNNEIDIASGGSFSNNGTVDFNYTVDVKFLGSGTVSGSSNTPFNNVYISGSVNFGSNSSILESLVINAGGSININPPTFESETLLEYATGGTVGRGLEWSATSGPGAPEWVQISGGTTLDLKNGSNTARQIKWLYINDGTLSMGDMTGTLTVSTELKILSTGTLTLSTVSGGDLIITGGDWKNSGTFNANSRKIFFSKGSSIVVENSGSGNFPYVTIDNGTNIHLSSGAMTITNELNLSDGYVRLSAPLTISPGGVITGASSTRPIRCLAANGTLSQTVPSTNTDVLYPFGNASTMYFPITLNNNGGTTDVYTIQAESNFNNVISPLNIVEPRWTITEAVNGGSNIVLTLQWNAAAAQSGFTQTGCAIGRYNGSGTNWTLLGTTNVSTTDPFSAKNSSAITGTGVFQSTKYQVGNPAALPVELVSFSGSSKRGHVVLHWNTATEKNNYGFEVESRTTPVSPPYKGGEGGGWNKIGFVEGNGTTNAQKEYFFTDKNRSAGKYSYRLKQIDRDGKFEYS